MSESFSRALALCTFELNYSYSSSQLKAFKTNLKYSLNMLDFSGSNKFKTLLEVPPMLGLSICVRLYLIGR